MELPKSDQNLDTYEAYERTNEFKIKCILLVYKHTILQYNKTILSDSKSLQTWRITITLFVENYLCFSTLKV